MDKDYLTTEGCAVMLERSQGAVRNLVLRRKIPYRKCGGRLVFIKSEIEQWVMDSPGVTLEDIKKQK